MDVTKSCLPLHIKYEISTHWISYRDEKYVKFWYIYLLFLIPPFLSCLLFSCIIMVSSLFFFSPLALSWILHSLALHSKQIENQGMNESQQWKNLLNLGSRSSFCFFIIFIDIFQRIGTVISGKNPVTFETAHKFWPHLSFIVQSMRTLRDIDSWQTAINTAGLSDTSTSTVHGTGRG